MVLSKRMNYGLQVKSVRRKPNEQALVMQTFLRALNAENIEKI